MGVLFLGLMVGCNEDSPGDMNNDLKNSGKVIFKITDAPFPSDLVAEANITVDQVFLLQNELAETEEENEGVEEDNLPGFFTIDLAEDSTFNLLELSNGITAFMGEVEVPAGEYREIRMHILDAEIILTDGTVYDLKVPGGSASGLKIKISPSVFVVEGEATEILLDFDVSRSFVAKGNFNQKTGKNNLKGFNFKPVIRAVPQVAAGQLSGAVSDTSGEVLENALIALISGTDTVTTAITTAEGYYAIIGIPDGTYSLACSKENYESQVLDNLDVAAGDVIEQDFILVPESEETTE